MTLESFKTEEEIGPESWPERKLVDESLGEGVLGEDTEFDENELDASVLARGFSGPGFNLYRDVDSDYTRVPAKWPTLIDMHPDLLAKRIDIEKMRQGQYTPHSHFIGIRGRTARAIGGDRSADDEEDFEYENDIFPIVIELKGEDSDYIVGTYGSLDARNAGSPIRVGQLYDQLYQMSTLKSQEFKSQAFRFGIDKAVVAVKLPDSYNFPESVDLDGVTAVALYLEKTKATSDKFREVAAIPTFGGHSNMVELISWLDSSDELKRYPSLSKCYMQGSVLKVVGARADDEDFTDIIDAFKENDVSDFEIADFFNRISKHYPSTLSDLAEPKPLSNTEGSITLHKMRSKGLYMNI